MTLSKTLAFLGCGNLGISMVKRLLQQGYPAQQILATRRSATGLAQLQELGLHGHTDNIAAVKKADVVVLAVRPSQTAALLAEVTQTLNEQRPILVSVVVGLPIETLAQRLHCAMIRAMPNVASALGEGVTIYQLADPTAGQSQAELEEVAAALFKPLGLLIKAATAQEVDSYTAISGCGPAYFLYFYKQLCDYGLQQGLPAQEVYLAAAQTLKGAARLLAADNSAAASLIDSIAAPHEDTATRRALTYMAEQGLAEIIKTGCARAESRAVAAGKEVMQALNES